MKTPLAIILVFVLCCTGLSAQTATSINNGNWTNPMTWSCTCVPTPGYTVIINNNVTLNTSFAYTSGSITINSGGSLVQDTPTRDIWINGGGFSNAGSVDVRFMLVQTGTFSNSGTMTMTAMANYLPFTNSGTIQNVDSLYFTGAVTNTGSFLNIDSITTAGSFINNGISVYNQFTNTGIYTNNNMLTFSDVTNVGTMINNDSITALNSGWNLGRLSLMPNSYFLVMNGFLNHDLTFEDAVIENNGRMNVLDSWYNFDTIKGVTGSFIVQDSSVNYGDMKESFDFCDLTPPSSAPYVDFNLGTVSSTITWCTNTVVNETVQNSISIYPNPATTEISIVAPGMSDFTITIYDAQGELILEYWNTNRIDVHTVPPGLYMIRIAGGETITTQKIMITQ